MLKIPNIPDRSRTCNLRLRRPTLYPIELRGRNRKSWCRIRLRRKRHSLRPCGTPRFYAFSQLLPRVPYRSVPASALAFRDRQSKFDGRLQRQRTHCATGAGPIHFDTSALALLRRPRSLSNRNPASTSISRNPASTAEFVTSSLPPA
jgi:hypothetical protein